MSKLNLKKNIFIARLLPFLLLFLIFTATKFQGGDDDIYTRINRNMDIFGRVYKEIALNYVDEIETDKFMKAGIDGMLNTLDPYTNFLDESRKDEMDLLTTGKYGGIGISIGMKDSLIVITEVMDGYSAQREGLKIGDKIIEIDGNNMIGVKMGDVRSYTRGEPGSQMKMKVKRGGQDIEVTLTRQEIKLKNVSYKGMLEDGIGYIKLDRFSKYSENEIADALAEIKSKGEIKGIILDLRDNPGGLLDAAVGILNKFVDKGSLLLTTRGRKLDSERKYFSTEDPVIKRDIPVAVLVNGNTASASEIVAGAIQDLDRGVIVGTKSFGKGLVQVFTPLSYNNQLKITNQIYFTPSGRWIQVKNYFKDNKYGVFKPNPFYNQTEFKTLNGRTVLPEGGIAPDAVVDISKDNELLTELSNQDIYFKFAEKYVSENANSSGFVMNDNVINAFYNYLNESGFTYKGSAEMQLDQLKKTVEEKKYSDKARNYIAELDNELKSERLNDFESSKPVIKSMLEIEILRKYNKPDKEVIDAGLKDDLQLQAALNIIKDRALYNGYLTAR
jgi:carboxyl-terminal processing protease